MIRFECDYSEGAHERIMRRLLETNMEQMPGYGEDEHCARARELIKRACAAPEAEVHFLVGGTQANTAVIASLLRAHQGVVSAATGHINIHETGAVEARGHKVLALPSSDGKLSARQVREFCRAHWDDATHEHIVQPGMVYISHPTENGTVYTKSELAALYEACREYSIPLFIDGARLGYGLAAEGNDLELPDIARLCDVFYIGGTKVGALFGEAVVIMNTRLMRDFRYIIKQGGGMLAKGRLLGIQFETLFEDGLYFDISRRAVKQAMRLRAAFEKAGFPLLFDSKTNQQYPVMPDAVLKQLSEKYSFSVWQRVDDTHTAARFCTSWATEDDNVDALIADVKSLCRTSAQDSA